VRRSRLLEAGEVDVVAGDAFVARTWRGTSTISRSRAARARDSLGVAWRPDATELEGVVRQCSTSLQSPTEILDTVRAKWVDDLPALEVAADDLMHTRPS
jgi:hypothetical protein